MARAREGDLVQVHFTGRFPDGTVFDTSEGKEPLEFEAGSKQLIPGFSTAVIGMDEGEERTVTVAPEDGFGPHHPELQQEVPREALPESVAVGDPLQAQAGDQVIQVWVKELGEETAIVDGNHPLAGKTLEFDLKVVSVTAAEK
jgi:FKBP-type peptidyl-prolyl cis-trans isomerase 2